MHALRLGWILVSGLAVAAACATGGDTTFSEPTGGGGAGNTNTTSTGGTGGGGSGTTTSTTTTVLPCGIDCATIQTDDCHVAVCNEQSKQCEVKNADNGAGCDDGQFCTVDDACVDGVCVGGPQNDCELKPGMCDNVVCSESQKSCSTTPKQSGSPCIAADLCQVSSTCQNGLCIGSPKDCFFAPVPDDCHVAVCNPQNGNCEPVPGNEGQICVDTKDLCTIDKKCAAGVCQGGNPKDCSQLTMGCNLGVCDTMTGQCTTKAVMQGQLCDDLDACTAGETCNNGMCNGGTPVTQCKNGDLCCPQGCTEQNDDDCGGTIPGFMGELGPKFSGWKQCEGYLDKSGVENIPKEWGNDCVNAAWNKVRLACGANVTTYRYIEVNKNPFKDGLASYPEKNLILAAKDQNGVGFTITNDIYATGNHPHQSVSWWNGGNGCGETNTNITINNVCPWEASNCFGQGVSGDRYLWIYVQ